MTSSVIYNNTGGARKNEIYLLNKLNDFEESKDITFDQLLQELNAFERQYILTGNTIISNHLSKKNS